MVNRNKIVPIILLFFLINGTFTTALNPVSASDLIEDSWNTKTSMSQPRFGSGVVVADGKIYAIGGYTHRGPQNINECYDPKTDKWSTLKSMPTPRTWFTIATCQGKIYCIGGATLGGEVYRVNEVYDTTTNSWSTKNIPFDDRCIQAHEVDGKIFVITQNVLYLYNPKTDKWTNKVGIPALRYHVFSVVMDNKIVMGYTEPEQQCKVVIYDPKTDKWSYGQSELFLAGSQVAAGVTSGLYAPKKIYVFSNTGDNTVYDPVSDTWSSATNSGFDTDILSVVIVDDLLYAIAGVRPPIFFTVNTQYVPIGYRSTAYATPTPSNSVSFESVSFKLSNVVVVLVLTCGTTITGLFFYFKKRRQRK